MEENVNGCYAQKPLKCIERIVRASSNVGDLVVDFFAHSGTTLLACEISQRRCFTIDTDPIFCEMAIRRLEHYQQTGRLGWQNSHAFEKDVHLLFTPAPEETVGGDLLPHNVVENAVNNTPPKGRGRPRKTVAASSSQRSLF
jgi:hypothetical protein